MRVLALSLIGFFALAAAQEEVVSITMNEEPQEFAVGGPTGVQIDPQDADTPQAEAAQTTAGQPTATATATGNTGTEEDPIATADVMLDNGSLTDVPADVPYDAVDDTHTLVDVPADTPWEPLDGYVVDSEAPAAETTTDTDATTNTATDTATDTNDTPTDTDDTATDTPDVTDTALDHTPDLTGFAPEGTEADSDAQEVAENTNTQPSDVQQKEKSGAAGLVVGVVAAIAVAAAM
eukprot:GDKI01038447.1.p1 GENE.GDKI01038447.1~~GDKI01038447.1.p1  ORF type:complete len:236 (-),score=98.48 GDKI01038447.1:85-792(-)